MTSTTNPTANDETANDKPATAIACVDVDYRGPTGPAVAAAVVLDAWTAADPIAREIAVVDRVEPYVPGQFYRRELPCLVAVLERVTAPLAAVVIDGYVWLASETDPGLGAALHQALGGRVAVVGVAKSPFRSSPVARELVRGQSATPLHITAVGIDPAAARGHVAAMAGPYRLPTALKAADRLCRDHPLPR